MGPHIRNFCLVAKICTWISRWDLDWHKNNELGLWDGEVFGASLELMEIIPLGVYDVT